MKTTTTLVLSFLLSLQISKAQTVAMDFTMDDCYGQLHHCFSTLDSGNVIIMEFFMTCNMCITAGEEVEGMKAKLEAQYPGKIRFYQLGFTNSYTCPTVLDWVNDNGFNSVPFDSGAALVAYYGGFGMPTLAVIAGSGHEILYTGVGYTSGDTSDIAASIHDYFNTTGLSTISPNENELALFPNPSNDKFNLHLNLKEASHVKIELLTLSGEMVAMLVDEKLNAGLVQKTIGTSSFAPGIYLVKTTMNGVEIIRRLTIAH